MSVQSYLRLVHDRSSSGSGMPGPRFEPLQASLEGFSGSCLFLCTPDALDESSFTSLFKELGTSVCLDLRVSPRFDFGTFNRRRAFAMFDSSNVTYIDQSASRITPTIIESAAHSIRRALATKDPSTSNRVAVLLDAVHDTTDTGVQLVGLLRLGTGADWELVLQRAEQKGPAGRDLIFISHANPEDNPFALWLKAQLTRCGYEVWVDLTQLRGGELFWDTIEETIRKRASRVLAVYSTAAVGKPGFQDEVALAVSVERTQKISGFVIPLRLDNLSYSDFRANVARKNTLDFSGSWARGFERLRETLALERVPRSLESPGLDRWWQRKRAVGASVTNAPEPLVSNRLEAKKLPQRIHLHSGAPRMASSGVSLTERSTSNFPGMPFQGGWLTFLTASQLRQAGILGIESTRTFAFDDFRRGTAPISEHLDDAARRSLACKVLNRHWENYLERRGLQKLVSPRKPPTLFFPFGVVANDQIHFLDIDKRRKKRLVIGESEKRRVFWHLGFISRFSISEDDIYCSLRLRILFTEKESMQLASAERTKILRRSFCKNWWNDRWRTLLLATVSWLSGDQMTIAADIAGEGLVLSTAPLLFTSPVSLQEMDAADAAEDSLDLPANEEDFDPEDTALEEDDAFDPDV